MWRELPPSLACQIIDEIDAGMPDGERFSNHNQAIDRAAWRVVVNHKPEFSEKQARKVIATWIKNDVLCNENYYSKKERKDSAVGLVANPAKRPGKTSA